MFAVTALGKASVLERISHTVDEINQVFSHFDTNEDGVLTKKEFILAYSFILENTTFGKRFISLLDVSVDEFFRHDGDDIDSSEFIAKCISKLCIVHQKSITAMPNDDLSIEDIQHVSNIFARGHKIAQEASTYGVKLLVDAEHTKYQPFIDALTLELQRNYNDQRVTNIPIIFNTYQCYLKEASNRVSKDLQRSLRLSYHFGAKLVRGAYMDYERSRAIQLNKPSPIFETIDETHACYNNLVQMILRKKVGNPNLKSLEIMCATHNKQSIVLAMETMAELDKNPNHISLSANSIHFAQLYGMSDHLTFPLGANKQSAYKYLPYGPMNSVMPYLLRRAQENSDVLGNASHEMNLLFKALKTRIFC